MKTKIRITQVWAALLCVAIIGNLIVNILSSRGLGNITKYNVLLWSLLIGCSLIINEKKLNINLLKFILGIMFLGILGNIHGAMLVKNGLSSVDNLILNFLIIIIFIAIKSAPIDDKAVERIMKTLVICGVITSVYAMITQSMYFIYIIKRLDVAYNSWFYTSFLGQRNILAGYCFLSSIAALYLMTSQKKIKNKFYGIAIVLFGLQIFVTNSRTASIAYLTLIFFYLFFVTGKKTKIILSGIIIFLVTILIRNKIFVNILNTLFVHITSSGVDSGSIRLNMWKGAIKYSIKNFGLLFGLGIFPVSSILHEHFEYASTHNTYLDALLVGGIVYLGLIIYIYIQIYKQIKSNRDIHYCRVMMSAFIAFILYNMTEAGMALFTQNYFSITATIIFVLLPYGYNKYIQNKNY